jgi:hypothetical protein
MDKENGNRPTPLTPEQVIDQAKETILQDGEHVPTIIADGSQRWVVIPIPEMGHTHDERRVQMFAAGFVLGHSRRLGMLRQVFFVSEGWLSLAEGKGLPKMLPSEDPKRREVLFVSSLKLPDRKADMVVFEMIRDSKGELVAICWKRTPPNVRQVCRRSRRASRRFCREQSLYARSAKVSNCSALRTLLAYKLAINRTRHTAVKIIKPVA